MSYEHIFTPITLNKVTIKNRIVSTAHAEVYAENGYPTERYLKYYEAKAKGGLGLAICGGSSPVSLDSPANWWKSIDLTNDSVIPHLTNLAQIMHKNGAKIMIQATHMGRRSNYYGGDWPHLVSPSGVREPVHRGVAKTIEYEDIKRIINDFGEAARRVKASGLDGIEISADHQHLIDQFWSPRVNKRNDMYGGSLENRMRFGFEVLESVRKQVGSDFCVGIRMCGDEFHADGLSHQDFKEIAQALSESKLIDFISVTGSGADTHNTLANCMPPMSLPPQPFLHLAAGIKTVVDIPVMHAQNIKDPIQAEKILASGAVDMVGMTRAHIADPYLMQKLQEGKENQIKQCVSANYCIDRQYFGQDVLCIQNAATSREATMPHIISQSNTGKRKIVVVGGGPAGLEAARVAKQRGHDVVLFEQQDVLGGQLVLAAKVPQREQIAGITRWFELELARLNVDLRLGSKVDQNKILEECPDIVIIATGGTANVLENPDWGFEEGLCESARDVLSAKVALKENILIYDVFSQHAGAGVADFVASEGKLVELVTPDVKAADDVGGTTFPVFYRRLYAHNVILTPNFYLDRVYAEKDKKIAVLRNEYTEQLEEREVDQVLIENGTAPRDRLYWQLKQQSLNKGITDIAQLYSNNKQSSLDMPTNGNDFLLYRVGESISPRNIHGAIYDSLRLVKDF